MLIIHDRQSKLDGALWKSHSEAELSVWNSVRAPSHSQNQGHQFISECSMYHEEVNSWTCIYIIYNIFIVQQNFPSLHEARINLESIYFYTSQSTALRKWIASLDNHMTSEARRVLKEAAADAGVEMVKKSVDKEGRTRVSKA